MKKNKEYVGIFKVHKQVSEEELKEEMKKFVGKIKQMPPVKSRVKRQERVREVYSWDLLEYDKEKKEVLFSCEVEAGTYVRKMISELGLKIGGSHMLELRRVKAGIFSESDSSFINLYELEKIRDNEEKLKEIIIPAEIISRILPSFQLKPQNSSQKVRNFGSRKSEDFLGNKEKLKQILTGKPLYKDDVKLNLKEGKNFVLFSGDRFIGVYRKVNEGEIIARAEFVFN